MKCPVCAQPQRGFPCVRRFACVGHASAGGTAAPDPTFPRFSGGARFSLQLFNLENKRALVGGCAIIAVAIYLVPTGAHVFELPNKIGLPVAQYMIVQAIYAGWAAFGVVIAAAVLLTAAHAALVRKHPTARRLALVALTCLAATQVIFWLFTYPINVASASWTRTPAAFEAARRQWEYSHAASAALTLLALIAIVLSVLAANRHRPGAVRSP